MPTGFDDQIILFDGVCNLCNGSVRFIIKRDPKNKFKFASLQSNAAKELLKSLGEYQEDWDSLVLVRGNKVYRKSTAALKISSQLSFPWPAFSIFLFLPRFLRDLLYSIVAKNRYRWFGKNDYCEIPVGVTQEERFLN